MKYSVQATSIIEAIIILMIVVTGTVWVYKNLDASQKLANTTWNRIQAIQIARDGLEWVTNIRDTNWLLYGADYENCWNTLNYNSTCIGNTTSPKIWTGSYKIYKNTNNQFELSIHPTWDYTQTSYQSTYEVFRDTDGFYTQSGSVTNLYPPLFTREIQISYPTADSMKVIALVSWLDNAKQTPHVLRMETQLTNWKSKQ